MIVLLVGSVLSYVFYWVAVIVVLVFSKFHEVSYPVFFCRTTPNLNYRSFFKGRTTLFGWESANRKYQSEELARASVTSSENNSQPEKTAVNGHRA